MPRRILLVEDPGAVVADLRRDLEDGGWEVDAVVPGGTAASLAEGRHCAAIVPSSPSAREAVAALRASDPHLPIVLLLAGPGEGEEAAEGADAVLAAPVAAGALAGLCALASRLRERSERVAELEGRLAVRQRSAGELDFLKRLLLAEVKRSKRYGYPLSLALVAVDGWPGAAPRLPARARARLLAELLGAISATLRDIDVAVPFSDERLVVVMPHTKAEGGLRVARRLAAVVRDRKWTPRLTVSVGVATHGGDGTVSFGGLVKRAGEALERARAAGGDRAEAADPVKKRDRIWMG